jgi:hypothetical protein
MKTSDALKFTAEIIETLEESGLTDQDMLVVLGAASKIISDRQTANMVEQFKEGFQQTMQSKLVEALNRKDRRATLKAVKPMPEKMN